MLVIFSHGNASDLGDVHPFGERLAQLYDVDFLAYDYTGYGIGKGKYDISEKQMYEDLQNVLSFATVQLEYKLSQIILWGFSLGSGPTIEVATRFPSVGGVVLQAPLASLLMCVDINLQNHKKDNFVNINKIQAVKSKMLIIHGNKDSVVNVSHSKLLFNKHQMNASSQNTVLFLEVGNADHNDLQEIILQRDSELNHRIQHFIYFIEQHKYILENPSSDISMIISKIEEQQEQQQKDVTLLQLINEEIMISSDSIDPQCSSVLRSASKSYIQATDEFEGLRTSWQEQLQRTPRQKVKKNYVEKRNYLLFCGCNELE